MRNAWKVLAVLAVMVPSGAYVVGALVPGTDPAPQRAPMLVRDDAAGTSPPAAPRPAARSGQNRGDDDDRRPADTVNPEPDEVDDDGDDRREDAAADQREEAREPARDDRTTGRSSPGAGTSGGRGGGARDADDDADDGAAERDDDGDDGADDGDDDGGDD